MDGGGGGGGGGGRTCVDRTVYGMGRGRQG